MATEHPAASGLFSTSGIRGVINQDLTYEILRDIGRAVGASLRPAAKVLIATDTRESRDSVKAMISIGLLSSGVNVVDAGILPTPILAFAVADMGMDMGIMITASHSPPEYNGLKLFTAEGIACSAEQEREIQRIYDTQDFLEGISAHYRREDGIETRYTEYLLEKLNQDQKKPWFSLAVDAGNSAASWIAGEIFTAFGYTVMTINDTPDINFPDRSPEPRKEIVEKTWQFFNNHHLDLAILFDGDADRVTFFDRQGFIGFTETAAFISALAVKRSGKKKVAATIETGKFLDNALAELGVEVVRGKAGDAAVANLTREIDAAIGVEPAGIFILPEYGWYPNPFIAAINMMAAVEELTEIREFIARVPPLYLGQRIITCQNDQKEILKKMMLEKPEIFGYGTINNMDGLRIDFEDSWVLVRASGTEPIFRVLAESTSQAETDRLLDETVISFQRLAGW
jgi:phosphoglucosamine mutase